MFAIINFDKGYGLNYVVFCVRIYIVILQISSKTYGTSCINDKILLFLYIFLAITYSIFSKWMTSDVPLLSMSLDHYLYLCYLDMQSFLCRFFLFCIFTSFVLALKSKSFSKLTLIKTNKRSSFISLYYCYTQLLIFKQCLSFQYS